MLQCPDKIDDEYSFQLLGSTYNEILDDWQEKLRDLLLKNKNGSIQVIKTKFGKERATKLVAYIEDLFDKCFDKLPEIRSNLEIQFREHFDIPKNVVLREDAAQVEQNSEGEVTDDEIESLIAILNAKKQSAIAYEKMTEVLLEIKEKQKEYMKKLREEDIELAKNEPVASNVFSELLDNFNQFFTLDN